MKLKYYIRGIGIGIVVTTLIFMVSILIHKSDSDSWKPAESEESKTIADMIGTETADTEGETTETAKNSASKQTEQKSAEVKSDTQEARTEPTDEKKTETEAKSPEQKESETTAKEDDKTQKDSEKKTDTASPKPASGKVRFEIGGGEFSDAICRRLQQEKLIDDAEAFNAFLIENRYDFGILPGVYDIPMGATYEEIAKLLTTKVEEN